MMFIRQIFKMIAKRSEHNQPAYATEAIAKMDLTIARLQQNKQLHLLCTDYLE